MATPYAASPATSETSGTVPAMTAGPIFNDKSFFFETLRALGYAPYGGADIGEVTSTASRIPHGDKTAWYTQWRALAERVHADADAGATIWPDDRDLPGPRHRPRTIAAMSSGQRRHQPQRPRRL
jgi:hypothetical protein